MKISELTPTEVLNDEDIFPVVQDDETKSVNRKNLFKHIPAPSEDDDVASKKYVDEKDKENTPTVDSALDENSTNAVQNAVVAREFKKVEKHYITEFDIASLNKKAITLINKNNQHISFYPFDFTISNSVLSNGKSHFLLNFRFACNFTDLETGEKHIVFSNSPEDVKKITNTYFTVLIDGEYFQTDFKYVEDSLREMFSEDAVIEYVVSYITTTNSAGDESIEYTLREEAVFIETTDTETFDAVMEQFLPILESSTKIAIEFKDNNIETKEGELIYG